MITNSTQCFYDTMMGQATGLGASITLSGITNVKDCLDACDAVANCTGVVHGPTLGACGLHSAAGFGAALTDNAMFNSYVRLDANCPQSTTTTPAPVVVTNSTLCAYDTKADELPTVAPITPPLTGVTVKECLDACDANANCTGAQYSPTGTCALHPQPNFASESRTSSPGHRTFIRLSSNCPEGPTTTTAAPLMITNSSQCHYDTEPETWIFQAEEEKITTSTVKACLDLCDNRASCTGVMRTLSSGSCYIYDEANFATLSRTTDTSRDVYRRLDTGCPEPPTTTPTPVIVTNSSLCSYDTKQLEQISGISHDQKISGLTSIKACLDKCDEWVNCTGAMSTISTKTCRLYAKPNFVSLPRAPQTNYNTYVRLDPSCPQPPTTTPRPVIISNSSMCSYDTILGERISWSTAAAQSHSGQNRLACLDLCDNWSNCTAAMLTVSSGSCRLFDEPNVASLSRTPDSNRNVYPRLDPSCPSVCPTPWPLTNGALNYSNTGPGGRFVEGSRADAICNPGYTLVGQPFSVCSGGNWNGTLPVCTMPTTTTTAAATTTSDLAIQSTSCRYSTESGRRFTPLVTIAGLGQVALTSVKDCLDRCDSHPECNAINIQRATASASWARAPAAPQVTPTRTRTTGWT